MAASALTEYMVVHVHRPRWRSHTQAANFWDGSASKIRRPSQGQRVYLEPSCCNRDKAWSSWDALRTSVSSPRSWSIHPRNTHRICAGTNPDSVARYSEHTNTYLSDDTRREAGDERDWKGLLQQGRMSVVRKTPDAGKYKLSRLHTLEVNAPSR